MSVMVRLIVRIVVECEGVVECAGECKGLVTWAGPARGPASAYFFSLGKLSITSSNRAAETIPSSRWPI